MTPREVAQNVTFCTYLKSSVVFLQNADIRSAFDDVYIMTHHRRDENKRLQLKESDSLLITPCGRFHHEHLNSIWVHILCLQFFWRIACFSASHEAVFVALEVEHRLMSDVKSWSRPKRGSAIWNEGISTWGVPKPIPISAESVGTLSNSAIFLFSPWPKIFIYAAAFVLVATSRKSLENSAWQLFCQFATSFLSTS